MLVGPATQKQKIQLPLATVTKMKIVAVCSMYLLTREGINEKALLRQHWVYVNVDYQITALLTACKLALSSPPVTLANSRYSGPTTSARHHTSKCSQEEVHNTRSSMDVRHRIQWEELRSSITSLLHNSTKEVKHSLRCSSNNRISKACSSKNNK